MSVNSQNFKQIKTINNLSSKKIQQASNKRNHFHQIKWNENQQ